MSANLTAGRSGDTLWLRVHDDDGSVETIKFTPAEAGAFIEYLQITWRGRRANLDRS